MNIEHYFLPKDLEAVGFSIFGERFDNDINIAFRAVRKAEVDMVFKNGFKSRNLESEISFAKSSAATLMYVDQYIEETDDDVCVFMVKFSNSQDKRIVQDGPYFQLYRTDKRPDILPKIIGYCLIPKGYR